jgi:hypothetical protein
MAGQRSRISRANRNFDDARAARLYRLRASGLQPGDPLPGAQQPQSASPLAEAPPDDARNTPMTPAPGPRP